MTEGLDSGTAEWGTTEETSAEIDGSGTLCANGAAGDVYFLNLRSTEGGVTLTAHWAEAAGGEPNLAFFRPDGWPETVYLESPGNSLEAETVFLTTDEIVLDFACANTGGTATPGDFAVYIGVENSDEDEVFGQEWWCSSLAGGGTYFFSETLTGLTAGWYEATVTLDAEGEVEESNESDNTWTVVFSVREPETTQTVTFDANGGECDTNTSLYTIGLPYGSLPVPERDGCAFEGWFAWDAGDDSWMKVTEDTLVDDLPELTLQALWDCEEEPVEEEYLTVMFNANGGNCDTLGHLYVVGEPYGWLPTPTWEGHSFSGWYPTMLGGREITEESTVRDTRYVDRMLYAFWDCEEVPETLEVSFDANGGSCETATREYALGEEYGWLPDAEWEGHEFAGWWTSGTGGTQIVVWDIVGEEPVETLHAHWDGDGGALRIVSCTVDAGAGLCTVRFTAEEGKTYQLWGAERLDGYWRMVRRTTAEVDGEATMEGAFPGEQTTGFYSVILEE